MSFKSISESVVAICSDVFGESIAYTPFGGSPVTFNGVFDDAYVDVGGVVSLYPVLRISLADLDALPAKGDTLTIATVAYSVKESRLDGYGGSTLILKKT